MVIPVSRCGLSPTVWMGLVIAALLTNIEVALSQAQPPQHPLAARRVHLHRVHTHRQNVAGAVHQHRQNVGGAIHDHRQNVGDIRRTRVDNVADRRRDFLAARAPLPAYQPATLTSTGTLVLPPVAEYVPPVLSLIHI